MMIEKPKNYAEMAAYLVALLGLSRQPVAIRFCSHDADYQASPYHEPVNGLPYCTAVAKATAGGRYKMDAAHCRCGAAATALGLQPLDEYRASGQLYVDLKVYRDLAVSRQIVQDMVYCPTSNRGVEIGPLEKSIFTPDMILLILPPKAGMRLLQGYAYHFGQLKDIKMAGMCAICQECTSYPYVKGSMNVSLLCAGTRCVGRWAQQELGVGIPYSQLLQVIDGIWQTVDAMEPDQEKKRILEDCLRLGISAPAIHYHQNYYSHCYGTPASLARRAAKEKAAAQKKAEDLSK